MKQLSFWLSWITLAAFTAVFLSQGNFEFILYAATLTVLIGLVQWSDRHLHYPPMVKWCFWLWLVMHMCGGFVHIGGGRLYDIVLIPLAGEPFHILRYDQFVHAFCYFMIGGLLQTIIGWLAMPSSPRGWLALVTVLAALGIGALNEIIEFSAVVFFDAGDGVGGYYNNALDNVFNGLGALAALAWFVPWRVTVHGGEN